MDSNGEGFLFIKTSLDNIPHSDSTTLITECWGPRVLAHDILKYFYDFFLYLLCFLGQVIKTIDVHLVIITLEENLNFVHIFMEVIVRYIFL